LLPKKIISAAHFCRQKSNFAAQKNKNVAAQKNNFAAQSNKFAAHFTNSLYFLFQIYLKMKNLFNQLFFIRFSQCFSSNVFGINFQLCLIFSRVF
jgi:hypothetical protein